MSYLVHAGLCAATLCAMMFIAPHRAEALPVGMKSPARSAVIMVRRECIAWERRKCVRWAECGKDVC